MKKIFPALSLLMAIAAFSCGFDGRTKCEKAKDIVVEGFKEYCVGKEEVCGTCARCNGDVVALAHFWNTEGTDTFIGCVQDDPSYQCTVLDLMVSVRPTPSSFYRRCELQDSSGGESDGENQKIQEEASVHG